MGVPNSTRQLLFIDKTKNEVLLDSDLMSCDASDHGEGIGLRDPKIDLTAEAYSVTGIDTMRFCVQQFNLITNQLGWLGRA